MTHGGASTQLALWAPRLGPKSVERLELHVKGNPTREEFVGWGVIRCFFGGVYERTISESRFAVNSEKRARGWEDTYRYRLGSVDQWDWKEVASVSRRLRYHVANRLAVGKTQPPAVHYVLPHADKLHAEGYTLVDGARRGGDVRVGDNVVDCA